MNDREATVTLDVPAELVHETDASRPSWHRIPAWPSDSSGPQTRPRTIERRYAVNSLARTTSIDPVRDSVTGGFFFAANEDARALNVSRHGMCLRCPRPHEVGTRLLVKLLLTDDEHLVEFTGRVRWTRVEFVPGDLAARPVALVGVELLGEATSARGYYERSLSQLARRDARSVAAREALG
jgi:hypothetical protein